LNRIWDLACWIEKFEGFNPAKKICKEHQRTKFKPENEEEEGFIMIHIILP
jgi:hypothetical protein